MLLKLKNKVFLAVQEMIKLLHLSQSHFFCSARVINQLRSMSNEMETITGSVNDAGSYHLK